MASILLIDDSMLTLAFAQSALQAMGHTVTGARDGVDGLAIAREEQPDMILTALSLPALDGLSVLRILRDEGCTAPFGIIGELQSDTTRRACDELGVVGSVARPVDALRIRQLVENALAHTPSRIQHAA